MNPSILSLYIRSIVPRITKDATLALAARKRAQGIKGDSELEDDGNYGSAATIDVEVLQAISKRVHYGIYFHLFFIERSNRGLFKENLYRNQNFGRSLLISFRPS